MSESKTHQQRYLDKALANEENANDHSLAAKSWRRATESITPKTMSPDEWELWYQTQGKSSPQKLNPKAAKPDGWLSWAKRLIMAKRLKETNTRPKQNCVRSVTEDSEF